MATGHGGGRKGSGRKPAALKEKDESLLLTVPTTSDPKEFLLSVMDSDEADARMRMDAAKALMPFMHLKLGEGGKKEQKQDATKAALGGKFAVKPTLVHSK